MADPVKAILSLENLSSTYSVFERDQVLTEAQLNSVSQYFDDQERLARVELLGIGIGGGLQASIAMRKVRVSKGVGVTTDGDLLVLPTDTVYDAIKPYDEKAPLYAPFYTAVDPPKMRQVWELVKEGESDVGKQLLTTLPGALTDYVVVMYMESYRQDHDLCSAADCDNLGVDAVNTPRMLLMAASDAKSLNANVPTVADQARKLPALAADRPQITGKITITKELADLYKKASGNTLARIIETLPELYKQLPAFTEDSLASDPTAAWVTQLKTIAARFAGATPNSNFGVQYFHDFLKDIVDSWNRLRDALLDCESVLCPDLSRFPKHLLLGSLASAGELRAGFYPSPLLGLGQSQHDHAAFLAQKLHALIVSFDLPAASTAAPVVVTPSRGESVSLEERAIPYYYQPNESVSLLDRWNYRLTKRGTQKDIPAYWAKQLGGTVSENSPLVRQIGCHDLFRIEGHLGQNVDAVMDKLEKQIAAFNLPFAVRAVLLHDNIAPLKRKPKIRYGDLHRIHKLVRADVDVELARTLEFSKTYTQRIKSAADNNHIPDPTNAKTKAEQRHNAIETSVVASRKAFAAKTYQAFNAENQWLAAHDNVVKTAGDYKLDFGAVSRTDYMTAFDQTIVSNHKNWLNWIDVLIKDKDKKADERLLFTTYLAAHPSVEHFGGVTRGGTFVVVYDDGNNVVADFMLPYREVDEFEQESDEPALPEIPPPRIPDGSIVVKPVEWRFEELKIGIRDEWMKEVKIQTDYSKFFKESLGTLGDVFEKLNPRFQGSTGIQIPDTGDTYLNGLLTTLETNSKQIETLRQSLPGAPPEEAKKIVGLIDNLQSLTGEHIQKATQQLVTGGVDIAAGKPGAAAINVVGSALATIKDDKTLKNIKTELTGIAAGAPAAGKNVVNGIAGVGGIKIG